jgi:hypothetical protein
MTKALAGYPYSTESVDHTVDDRLEAEQRLERATSELGEEHEIEIERAVAEGSAAQVLTHAVPETDLLVVGRGRPTQPVSRPTHER